MDELELASRGSATVNVNVAVRRTPSGIVFTDFSVVGRTPAEIRYVSADSLNVRNGRNADTAWQDTIQQYSRVEILEEYTNSWTRIKYDNNKTGFVNGKYLTSTAPPLEITALKAGNTLDGRWLTDAGSALYSSRMRYLAPFITYNATFSGKVTLFVKIFQPDAVLFRNSSISPAGFTYSTESWLDRGDYQTLQLPGWGNSDESVYAAGEWTIEIWYKNRRLWSEKITIRP